jgi:rubrerythrin
MTELINGKVKAGRTVSTGEFESAKVEVEIPFSVPEDTPQPKVVEKAQNLQSHVQKYVDYRAEQVAKKPVSPASLETGKTWMERGKTMPGRIKEGEEHLVEQVEETVETGSGSSHSKETPGNNEEGDGRTTWYCEECDTRFETVHPPDLCPDCGLEYSGNTSDRIYRPDAEEAEDSGEYVSPGEDDGGEEVLFGADTKDGGGDKE